MHAIVVEWRAWDYMVVCCIDTAGLTDAKAVQLLYDETQLILYKYVHCVRPHDPSRFSQLLLIASSLRAAASYNAGLSSTLCWQHRRHRVDGHRNLRHSLTYSPRRRKIPPGSVLPFRLFLPAMHKRRICCPRDAVNYTAQPLAWQTGSL